MSHVIFTEKNMLAFKPLSPNLFILLVSDIARSTLYYSHILGAKPIFESPRYVAFSLDSGVMLSLWTGHLDYESKEEVPPLNPGIHTGMVEISFMLDTETEVDDLYAKWVSEGVSILEPPAVAVFGKTFVAIDPDGHRLRVCLRD